MANDPNEFIQPVTLRKWPAYAVIAVVVVALSVMAYSIHWSRSGGKEEKAKPQVILRDDKPLVNEGGMGLASPPPPPPASKKESPEIPPIVVVTSNEPPELRREREELRRQKHQAAMTALVSPMVIRKGKDDAGAKAGVSQAGAKDGEARDSRGAPQSDRLSAALTRGGDYNPASDKDKEAFLERSKASDRQWQASSVRMAGQPFEVKTGSVIPAVMVGGINSDLPGQIIAQVSQNVFDTADGRHLLIPQGSKLYGVYDSRIVYGQSRVLVAWNRIIFPDGSAITLESMPGTDSAGFGGFEDQANNHYFRIFGTALLMSLITGGTAWAVDTVTPTTSASGLTGNASPSLQQQMTSALATQLGQTTAQVLSKGMNVKPTLEIRPGYRFNVVVTKDLVFREPYRDL